MTFETIHKQSAPEMVAGQIIDRIRAGELPPGSRLPAQRDLARMLGVGRSSVREAINALVVMGYLEAVQGSGTFVRERLPDLSVSAAGLSAALGSGSILDLMEARAFLECKSAELAAERANADDLRRLKRVVAAIEATDGDYDIFLEADIRFHTGVAEATGNGVIQEMTKLVLDHVVHHHRQLKTARLSDGYRRFSIRSAREVVRHIQRRDGRKASAWMHRHLDAIREELGGLIG